VGIDQKPFLAYGLPNFGSKTGILFSIVTNGKETVLPICKKAFQKEPCFDYLCALIGVFNPFKEANFQFVQ